MARKKQKEQPLIEGVEITGVAAEGKAVARIDDFVVFIPFGAPGDVADVRIVKKKHSYGEGRIERMVAPSTTHRTEPVCEHFGTCGGCKWQHLPYAYQLECKRQQVVDALDRIGHVKHPEVLPIIGADPIYEYRNKLEFTFSNRKWLTFEQLAQATADTPRNGAGFHIPGSFDKVLDINACHLMEPFNNRLRLFIKDYAERNGLTFSDPRTHEGLLRTMMVRTASTCEKMALIVFGEDDREAIASVMAAVEKEFPEITSLIYTVNTKLNDSFADLPMTTWSGAPFITEAMGELRFRVGPKSFYQTNSRQAQRLYETAREFAALTGNEVVYDLYTGTGTIACFVAGNARRVVGIEYVPEAIADAKVNAEVNGLADKTAFFAGDMKDVLNAEFIEREGRPDVVIVDPPRAGMHTDVVDTLLKASPERIVYVSCNPATQARDLALLTAEDTPYSVTAVQPVDMFPHTAHVENVVLIEKTR